ncbi:MAG: peptidase M64 [Ignavibacteriae bacterium]|jgi:hypothetical protein|nr:peptidase M64 [Ignavibacteriota bacterium]NOG96514.1 peptidase M64 [Ignavibacteriota bacterium]
MKLIFFFFITVNILFAQIEFDKYFENKTLRIDYFETGNNETEIFSFDKLIEEPYWGGSKTNLIDTLGFGLYHVKVLDNKSGSQIYSTSYSTLFAEWQTIAEAEQTTRSFSGTITIPYPKDSVNIEIYKRNRLNNFIKKFEIAIDPNSYFVIKDRKKKFDNFRVHYSGDPAEKLDIVFLPEGYTADEIAQFKNDCQEISNSLFKFSPFKEYENSINIWGVAAPSKESGTDIPGEDVWKNTIMNTKFYTFDTERYIMTDDYHAVKDVAANAPYDQIYILVNSDKYGGGAIYNFYSCSVTKDRSTDKIFVHELGHGLAGLADEYHDPNSSYQNYYPIDIEPWEANITTLVNFDSKWKYLLNDNTEVTHVDSTIPQDRLGIYEGGGYVTKGVYRPTVNSIMNTLKVDYFNEPSLQALIKVIEHYSSGK